MKAVGFEPSPFAGQAALRRALARELGSDSIAKLFLHETLQESGYDTVPDTREPFATFVREEILPRLMPLIRLEQMHDLVRRTIGEEGSLHPVPLKKYGRAPGSAAKSTARPRVVVVEPDAFRRVQLSRALVSAGFDVEVVASAAEIATLDAFHALVMPLDDEGEKVVTTLAARKTRAGLVIYDEPSARDAIRRTIDTWPSDRVSLVARDVTPAGLCARVRIVLT